MTLFNRFVIVLLSMATVGCSAITPYLPEGVPFLNAESTELPSTEDTPATPVSVPTPFGTEWVNPTEEAARVINTPTPVPRSLPCLSPITVENGIIEMVMYELVWRQTEETQLLETRGGPIEFSAPVTFPGGLRRVLIIHNAPLPAQMALPELFEPGQTLVLDPAQRMWEVRNSDGSLRAQHMSDPLEDVRGLVENLDILEVERQFGDAGGMLVRVTNAEPDDGKYIWTFEGVELILGGQRFANRTLADGQTLNLVYDGEGQPSDYGGSVIKQAETFTWSFDEASNAPFSIKTYTSASEGDSTIIFPTDQLQALWNQITSTCG